MHEQSDELVPLLTLDVWVNAYYVDMQVPYDFKKDIWKIINWDMVATRLAVAQYKAA